MTLRRALALLAPHRAALMLAGVLLGVAAVLPPAAVWVLEGALSRVLAGNLDGLALIAAAFAALYAVHAVVSVIRTTLTKRVAWRATSTLRRRLHDRFLRVAPPGATGDRLAALTDEVDHVQYGVSALVTAVRDPLTLAALGATAATLAPSLAVWALVLLGPIAVAGWLGGRRVRRIASEVRARRADLQALAHEQLSGVRTVRAFGVVDAEVARFEAVEATDRRARVRLEVERTLPSLVVRVLAATGVATLLVLGGRGVASGDLAPSELVAFVVALGLMAGPMSRLAEVWSLLQRSLAALERVDDVLAEPEPPRVPADPVPLPDGPLSLRWDGVTVCADERALVDRVSIQAPAGAMLALVGATGAGKTTLLRLAHGALEPDEGAIRLGGADLARVPASARHRAVAVVHQEGFLFARSVLDNVRLGRPGASIGEVRAVLGLAGLPAERLEDVLPAGLDTVLDERAHRLSGGERQRLCLARALLTGARVLLLDEPTSQVDPETTHALTQTLRTLRGDHTVVVVAHDPALALRADHVVVLADGRVVEQGPPRALLGARGRLWRWAGEGTWASAVP